MVEEQYPTIIQDAGIEPYGPGNLEKIETLDPPILEIIIPLKPVVAIDDSMNIRHPYEPPIIDDLFTKTFSQTT